MSFLQVTPELLTVEVTVHALHKDANFLMKSVAKLAKSFGIVPSITENLGDFRYKP